MNQKLIDLNLQEFAAITASDAPAPGGGSIAATAALFAAALGQMVIRLSAGKKFFLAYEPARQEALMAQLAPLEKAHQRLLALIDEDTEAFAAYMAAMKLPKETDEQKAERQKAMQAAAVRSMEIPMETAEQAVAVLRLLPLVANDGNPNAVTDAGSAALMARAATEAALWNVRVNLPSIKDEAIRTAAAEKAKALLTEAETLVQQTHAVVEAKLA